MIENNNTACGLVSWRPCQSQSTEQFTKFDPVEMRQQFLERAIAPKPAITKNRAIHRAVNPTGFHLAQIEWAIFGALTWRAEALATGTEWAHKMRLKDFYHLLGVSCSKHRLRPRRLMVYAKSEWGNGRRGHLHFLIGKAGMESIAAAKMAETMREIWIDRRVRGTAFIVPFNPYYHLDGVLYQSKYEFDQTGDEVCIAEDFSKMLQRKMECCCANLAAN